jgi:hypothetical protein
MARTVADMLVGTLEEIGVRHVFGLIGDSLNPSPTRFGAASSNGSASATRRGRRWPPRVRPSSPDGSPSAPEPPAPAAPT